MQAIIKTKNLTKYYPRIKSYKELLRHPLKRDCVLALQRINITVERGSIVGLLGPNGAGKTTLIKIFSTLVHPTAGTAQVNGYDVVTQGKMVRRSIGLVMTEERSFYWRLTGRQNLQFFAALNNLSGHERDRRIQMVIDETELHDDCDRMFKDYSTGMKQRLAIARGLLCDPDIILLDEPTRSLDPYNAQHMRTFIKEKIIEENKRTAILATHNLQEAEDLCTHIAIIKDGILAIQGTKEAIRKKYETKAYMLRLSSEPSINLGLLQGVETVKHIEENQRMFMVTTNNIAHVLTAIIAQGVMVEECYAHEITLTDVFKEIIEKEN